MGRLWLLVRSIPDDGPNACPECGHAPRQPHRETVEWLSAEEDAQFWEGEVEGCPHCLRTLCILYSKEVGTAAPERGGARERALDAAEWESLRRRLEEEG